MPVNKVGGRMAVMLQIPEYGVLAHTQIWKVIKWEQKTIEMYIKNQGPCRANVGMGDE